MTNDELVSVFIEKFKLNNFTVVGLDHYDILWSSHQDNCGITWNIISKDIDFFNYGQKIGFISFKCLEKGEYDIDPITYDNLINLMIKSLQPNMELKGILNNIMSKYISDEKYEEVIPIKEFLKLIYGN